MRTAYLLTTDEQSNRTKSSKDILQSVGFNIKTEIAFDYKLCNNNRYQSHLLSFRRILEDALLEKEDWFYFFEDDIAICEPIQIDEIIKYENICDDFFYLGCCLPNTARGIVTEHQIQDHIVYKLHGDIRGSHALGISKKGAKHILDFLEKSRPHCADMFGITSVDLFVPCIRFNLVSPQHPGHRGIFYQDRLTHPSIVSNKTKVYVNTP